MKDLTTYPYRTRDRSSSKWQLVTIVILWIVIIGLAGRFIHDADMEYREAQMEQYSPAQKGQ